MLLDRSTLAGIARGEITLAFRRWRRPTVRSGGTLLTGAGQLRIGAVSVVQAEHITAQDAAAAGHASLESLLSRLNDRQDGELYRVELLGLGPDPRIALREAPLQTDDIADLQTRLDRLDRAAQDGPWTRSTLQAIRDHPGLRATDLCRLVGQDRARFKTNVRKLKALGLTISLEVGYRLSPRGEVCLNAVAAVDGTA